VLTRILIAEYAGLVGCHVGWKRKVSDEWFHVAFFTGHTHTLTHLQRKKEQMVCLHEDKLLRA
jgi:hypothetical protein